MTTHAALRKIAEGLYELADALFAESAVAEATAPATARPSPIPEPFEEVAAEIFPEPQGSAAMCPKHHIPYTSGQYGDFCKSTTDDPAWGKQKGDKLWCRITPKNAAEWLRITAAA